MSVPALLHDQHVLPSLEQLAETANREHREVGWLGSQVVERAVCAGEALNLARKIIKDQHRGIKTTAWTSWLRENFEGNLCTANKYMRLARHKDQVSEVAPATISAALQFLVDKASSRNSVMDDATVAEIQQLRADGLSYAAISERTGYSRMAVYKRADPERWERDRQRLRARTKAGHRLLGRQERDAAVKAAGGSRAIAYEHIRKALQVLERERENVDAGEQRRLIHFAMTSLYNAEDAIGKAVRLS